MKDTLIPSLRPTVHLSCGREIADALRPAEQPSPDDRLWVDALVLHHHHCGLRYPAGFRVQGPDTGDFRAQHTAYSSVMRHRVEICRSRTVYFACNVRNAAVFPLTLYFP